MSLTYALPVTIRHGYNRTCNKVDHLQMLSCYCVWLLKNEEVEKVIVYYFLRVSDDFQNLIGLEFLKLLNI